MRKRASVWVIVLAAAFTAACVVYPADGFAKQSAKSSKGQSPGQTQERAKGPDPNKWDIMVQRMDLGGRWKKMLAEYGLPGYPLLFRIASKSPTKDKLILEFNSIKFKDSAGQYYPSRPFAPESAGACLLFSILQSRVYVYSTSPSSSVMCSDGGIQVASYPSSAATPEPVTHVASVCDSDSNTSARMFGMPSMPVYPAVATVRESKPGIVEVEVEGAKIIHFFLVFDAPETAVPSTVEWAGTTFTITERKQ